MKYLGLFLLTGFVGLAVFGGFAMHAGAESHDNGCIAVLTQGVDCPKKDGSLDALSFHPDTFRSFSSAVFTGQFAISILTLILIAAAGAAGIDARAFAFDQRSSAGSRYRLAELLNSNHRREFMRWLALRENSPAPF